MPHTRREFLATGLTALVPPDPPVIDCAYPGGNIVVDSVNGDVVEVHQELRDTSTDWFYWNFRVRGAAGRLLTFRLTRSRAIGVLGPAVSVDEGRSWTWLGVSEGPPNSFRYRMPAGVPEVRFSSVIPYLEADWRAFAARFAGNPAFRESTLCRTRKDRRFELVEAGDPGVERPRILLTARHHACESMAGYELEGVLERVLADDEAGRWWRGHVWMTAVPFMDKDGVEDGDQGKNRRPRDHNRDYDGESIHPSVAALRKLAGGWAEGRLLAHLDLHCPNLPDREISFIGGPDARIWGEAEKLSRIVSAAQTGPLKLNPGNNMPFGTGWNVAGNYSAGMSSTRWMAERPGIRLVATIELPYASAGGAAVTPASARAFGRDLADALRQYLGG